MSRTMLENLGRALFDQWPDALFVFDPETDRLLEANPRALQLIGLPLPELRQVLVCQLFGCEDPAGPDRLRAAVRLGEVFCAPAGFRLRVRPEGAGVPVRLTATRLNAPPSVLGLIAAHGADDSRAPGESHPPVSGPAVDLLQHEGFLLGTLMDHLPDTVYFKDTESRFIRVNQALARRHGLKDPAEAIGKTDFDYFTAEHALPAFQDEQEVMRTGRPIAGKEEKEVWTDGHVTWVSTTKIPLYDPEGRVIGTFGITRDITEHKRAEEAVRESERRYRALTEASLDAIVVADQQGCITLFNPAAERTFGYTAAEVLGQPIGLLMPEEYRVRHQEGLERYARTRQPRMMGRPIEMRGRRKDGSEFPLELSLTPLDLGGELQFLGTMRDLSERNRMRDGLIQSEKLASIGVLSAGVAHEINNPLSYVANNLAVLERDAKGLLELASAYEAARGRLAEADPPAAARLEALAERIDLGYLRDNLGRLLARTREGVQRVARIVQSLRSLARTAPPERETAHLSELIETSLEMVRGQIQRRGIALEVSHGTIPPVPCMATLISQVVLNLLVNALQATEATGQPEGKRIRVATLPVGSEALIEVADDGCGIPDEDLPRIFDPFFTTKPVGEGTGLGLSITHSIVTGHGGRIEVVSRPGEGTCFRIYLPLDPQRGPA